MSLPLVALPPLAGGTSTDSLAGRVILISGAYGGLGAAVARGALSAGATVVISGKRQRLLEKLYDEVAAEGLGQPLIHPLDMENATPKDYAELAQAIEGELGRLDGIVHAAASFNGLTPLAMQRPDDWLRALHVNVSAPFALTQACMPLLLAAPDSAVVFVLDDPGRTRRAHWGGYGVSKAALEGLVEILHQETEHTALRTHALLPAPMRTGLRRMAYFGEDTSRQPLPAATAEAVIHLLSPSGHAVRGAVLDLRVGD